MEVTLFGGCPEWPSNPKTDADFPQTTNATLLLQFGELILLASLIGRPGSPTKQVTA